MSVRAARRPARGGAAREKPRPAKAPLTVTRPELLVDGSDERFRHLVHDLFGFFARHEAIRNGHAARIGLVGIEYTVLISIAHLSQAGAVSVKAVADHLRVSGTFVTRIVGRLVELGLATKTVRPDDRRLVSLLVSPHGHERLERLAPTQRQVNDVEFGCLSADEFLALSGMIERLIETSEQAVALQAYLDTTGLPLTSPARRERSSRPSGRPGEGHGDTSGNGESPTPSSGQADA